MSKSNRPKSALYVTVFAQPKREAFQPDFKQDEANVAYTKKRNDAENKVIMMELEKSFELEFGGSL